MCDRCLINITRNCIERSRGPMSGSMLSCDILVCRDCSHEDDEIYSFLHLKESYNRGAGFIIVYRSRDVGCVERGY